MDHREAQLFILLSLIGLSALGSLPHVNAIEVEETYPCRESLPVHIPGDQNAYRLLHIDGPLDTSRVMDATLVITVYNVEWPNAAVLEFQGTRRRLPRTGTDNTGTIELPIAVAAIGPNMECRFEYSRRQSSWGFEVTALSLVLTVRAQEPEEPEEPEEPMEPEDPENQPPIAVMGNIEPETEGVIIPFDGTASYDPDGVITQYAWTFGDNASSLDDDPTHIYEQDGDYLLTLTVTDAQGATDTTTQRIQIMDRDPIAAFTVTPMGAPDQAVYRFTDLSMSYDGLVTWRWDFGDGAVSRDPMPLHEYTEAGSYTVTLTVSEADGDSTSLAQDLEATIPGQTGSLLTITPTSQLGWNGSTLLYSLEVSSPTDTPMVIPLFQLAALIPDGWNASLTPSQVTVPLEGTTTSVFALTPHPSTPTGTYTFTLTATTSEPASVSTSITGTYVLIPPPQVTVTADVTSSPLIHFTVTCAASNDVIQELCLFIDDSEVMRWTTPGIHTYDWRAPTRDTCTYYVEARAPSGATLRDPSSDAYQLALSRPQISWHFLLISLLLTLTLSGVVYLWLSRTR